MITGHWLQQTSKKLSMCHRNTGTSKKRLPAKHMRLQKVFQVGSTSGGERLTEQEWGEYPYKARIREHPIARSIQIQNTLHNIWNWKYQYNNNVRIKKKIVVCYFKHLSAFRPQFLIIYLPEIENKKKKNLV